MKNSNTSAVERKEINQLINNAWELAKGPCLELNEFQDDPQARYFTSYEGEKIVVIEKTDGFPLRTIAIFPASTDGKVAAGRVCDSLNSKDGNIGIDESLSFEKHMRGEAVQSLQHSTKNTRGEPIKGNTNVEHLFAR